MGYDHNMRYILHFCCLTSFTGSNDCCALGRPTVKNSEDNKDQILPAPVPFFTGKEVVQVSCGDAHMAALLSDGTMYNWGVYRDASG